MPKYELVYDKLTNGNFSGPHFKYFDAVNLISGRKMANDYILQIENDGNTKVMRQRIKEYKEENVFGQEHTLEEKLDEK